MLTQVSSIMIPVWALVTQFPGDNQDFMNSFSIPGMQMQIYLLLSVMGAFVQFERELIRERQHDAMRSRCGKGSTPAGSRV
jgi:DNA invertase Pin-like site-specific DNA recombinase